MRLRRRGFLVAGLSAVTVAGCARKGGSDATPSAPDVTRTETAESTGADGSPATPDLDLREANVTGVEIERSEGRSFDVSVTLFHDDDGEEGYANWWQVETLDGGRLGRRELLHAHGNRAFTRSADVGIPEGVSCVVVRGHDETHGYGGRAMLVDVDAGAMTARRQGSERVGFSSADCP